MKIKLPFSAFALLQFVLSSTGEKELDARGNEVMSPRRLNSEEAGQRMRFVRLFEPDRNRIQKEIAEISADYNKRAKETRNNLEKSNPRKEDEKQEDYDKRIGKMLQDNKGLAGEFAKSSKEAIRLQNIEIEIDIDKKLQKMLEKYIAKYGDEIGWGIGDDETVEKISKELK